MSPARPGSSSRKNSPGGPKPYARGVSQMAPIPFSDYSTQKSSVNVDRPSFPTYAAYKQVENAYLQSLTPRRQGKALISQSMFDRIWDVLQQPDQGQGETAQFRFWARKMFSIDKTHRTSEDSEGNDAPQEVLVHDNLLVAIQEQLYDLLCYCHGSTGHGGRDKTCALIRKHYTWVPKDLVANFIKACPTCIVKKCGNIEGVTAIASHMAEGKGDEPHLPGGNFDDFFQSIYSSEESTPSSHPVSPPRINSIPWPTTGSPADESLHPSMDALESDYAEAAMNGQPVVQKSSPRKMCYGGVPMRREVALYKGLPNGWQYRYPDYATAHAEFMKIKDPALVEECDPFFRDMRHRIPSIAPLWGPDDYPGPLDHYDLMLRPPPEHGQLQGNERDSNVSLDYMLMSSQHEEAQRKAQMYTHQGQIDPILMNMARDDSPTERRQASSSRAEPDLGSTTNFPSTRSIKRAAAPRRINLEFPNEKTFQALLAYRESLGDGNITPDSPMMSWHPGNPSPASSESSSSSQLSPFPMSESTTPASSTLTTPVDECGSSGPSALVKGKDGKGLPESAEVELSANIQTACGI